MQFFRLSWNTGNLIQMSWKSHGIPLVYGIRVCTHILPGYDGILLCHVLHVSCKKKQIIKKEMDSVLGHLCAHITGPGEPPEDGEMTLPSRHRIRNWRPGGLGLNTIPLVTKAPYNIESLRVSGEETFCFFETSRPEWGSNPRSPTFQAGSFNHCTRALANIQVIKNWDSGRWWGRPLSHS